MTAVVLPILENEREKTLKNRSDRKRKYAEVDYLLIDSFETPIGRASINEKQRKKYSAKKKTHTLKSQLITDQNGEIIQIDAGFDGPKSDIEIYRDTRIKKTMAGEREIRR